MFGCVEAACNDDDLVAARKDEDLKDAGAIDGSVFFCSASEGIALFGAILRAAELFVSILPTSTDELLVPEWDCCKDKDLNDLVFADASKTDGL